jgi:hypothetical protein
MKRCRGLALLGVAVFGLVLLAPLARTSPVDLEKPLDKVALPGNGRIITTVTCQGNQSTFAIAATRTESGLLAMYVYDAHGNCVGRDEFNERPSQKPRRATNDCGVEWFAPTTGPYLVEVRNQSLESCVVQMTIQ